MLAPNTFSCQGYATRRLLQMATLLVAIWLGGCASLPEGVSRPVSRALSDPQETTLGQTIEQYAATKGAPYRSGFRLLGRSESAYASRLALVDAAQKTLDLQYYAILVDQTTEQFVLRLREAAARGVRVRILLDDFNTTGANAQFLRLALVPNIEMRLFNPLPGSRSSLVGRVLGSLGNIEQAQRRMHNKLFIADNAMAIAGGRNLGDAYFGQSTSSNFIDLDVLAAGQIVRNMSASFDAYWNNTLAYPVQSLLSPRELADLRPDATQVAPPPAEIEVAPLDLSPAHLTWANALLLVDKADKIAGDGAEAEDTVVDGLLRLIERTRQDVFIVSPYFVPGEAMMAVFAKVRAAGVRIRVLTNSLASTDAPLAHVGYARYRERLIEMGVELYEMRAEWPHGTTALSTGSALGQVVRPGSQSSLPIGSGVTGSGTAARASLHAKALVLDGSLIVVGSMNLDLRSQLQNSEVALLIRSSAMARRALELAEPVLRSDAYRVDLHDDRLRWQGSDGTFSNEPGASTGLQFILKLLGPLAPDEML
jgi:putative cardiolipin synthase